MLGIKLHSKYRNFQISNYIIIAFILLVVLSSNFVFYYQFGFNQALFIPISTFLVIIALFLYRYLSHSLFDEFFKSDEQIDNMIKKTLHELNTPVATIQMNTQLLEKNIQNEKDLRRIERIKNSCENLLELYKKTEYEISSKIDKIKKEQFDIKDIIEKSIVKVDDIKQNITIETSLCSHIINADKFGFEVMIDNLLSNAIKYNKKDGFIKISQENNTLIIEDSGCGIDTKHIFQIYDKYFQVDIEAKGIGLGLSIVKEYCDKNQIDIKIDSKENKGTKFILHFNKKF